MMQNSRIPKIWLRNKALDKWKIKYILQNILKKCQYDEHTFVLRYLNYSYVKLLTSISSK